MILRNKDIEPEKSGCLICDDIINTDESRYQKNFLKICRFHKGEM